MTAVMALMLALVSVHFHMIFESHYTRRDVVTYLALFSNIAMTCSFPDVEIAVVADFPHDLSDSHHFIESRQLDVALACDDGESSMAISSMAAKVNWWCWRIGCNSSFENQHIQDTGAIHIRQVVANNPPRQFCSADDDLQRAQQIERLPQTQDRRGNWHQALGFRELLHRSPFRFSSALEGGC